MAHRENSPDFSHPLQMVEEDDRVQQMRLLEVPGNGSRISRQSSVASSLTDLGAPIYSRIRHTPQQVGRQFYIYAAISASKFHIPQQLVEPSMSKRAPPTDDLFGVGVWCALLDCTL
jgi:hypothetical protein